MNEEGGAVNTEETVRSLTERVEELEKEAAAVRGKDYDRKISNLHKTQKWSDGNVQDHLHVLREAVEQLPKRFRKRIWRRLEGNSSHQRWLFQEKYPR